jgi:hypothetical protein
MDEVLGGMVNHRRSWLNQEIDWSSIPPRNKVIGIFTAHAVSPCEAGLQPQRLQSPFGHGMEPKIFWSVCRTEGAGDSPKEVSISMALIPMGAWCSGC